MDIPKFDEIMPAALSELSKFRDVAVKWKSLEEPLAEHFGLTEEDLSSEYDSGNGRIFLDRIGWALSYLAITKLIERSKRGYCKITETGLSLVGKEKEIKAYIKNRIAEHEAQKKAKKVAESDTNEPPVLNSEVTPDEALNEAAKSIRDNVYEDILDTILSKKPYEFEKLVVKLLDRMGYGGMVKDPG